MHRPTRRDGRRRSPGFGGFLGGPPPLRVVVGRQRGTGRVRPIRRGSTGPPVERTPLGGPVLVLVGFEPRPSSLRGRGAPHSFADRCRFGVPGEPDTPPQRPATPRPEKRRPATRRPGARRYCRARRRARRGKPGPIFRRGSPAEGWRTRRVGLTGALLVPPGSASSVSSDQGNGSATIRSHGEGPGGECDDRRPRTK